MLKRALLVTLVAAATLLAVVSATDDTTTTKEAALTRDDVAKWPIKKLKQFLTEREVTCEGCAEKSDFIDMVVKHVDTPTKEELAKKEEKVKAEDEKAEEEKAEEAEEEKKEEAEEEAEADKKQDDEEAEDVEDEKVKPKESGEKFQLTDEMFELIRDAMSKEEGMGDIKREDMEKIFEMFPADMAEEMVKGFVEAGKNPPEANTAETNEEKKEEEEEEEEATPAAEDEEDEDEEVKDEL
ncbi:hypothetical protein BDF22DRAFT_674279 [Syncephalis plumigaleata]|nr:hypothetical protein BDF22DRAFT_674279 [Syncephalis plumigaleata]